MNTQPDSPGLHRSMPLAVPIGICSVLLLSIIAFAVYNTTYTIAIKKLKEHEVVDLADETRKNADGLRDTLAQLREDVLTLSRHPKVETLINSEDTNNRSLRTDLEPVFIDICRAHDPVIATEGVPNWKHYMQVRLIDSDGHERVRIQRTETDTSNTSEENPWLEKVPVEELDADAEADEGERQYYKKERDYFKQTKKIFDQMKDSVRPRPLAVSMSEIEFNRENENPSSPMHNVLTIRASVPLTQWSEGQLQFRGVLIINLDLESTLRALTDAQRHLVYLGSGETGKAGLRTTLQTMADSRRNLVRSGSGQIEQTADLEKPPYNPVLIYNPRYAGIQKPVGGETRPAESFKNVLHDHIEDCRQFERELRKIFSASPEQTEAGNNNDSVLPLEDRGQKLPENSLAGTRLLLKPGFQFRLMKMSLHEPANPRVVIPFREKVSKILNRHRSKTVRAPRLIREGTSTISIRASGDEELMSLVRELEALNSDNSSQGSVTREYSKPAVCRTFAAQFYRVYFDPARPHRYLALLVGFSDEELTADLASTRSAASQAFFTASIVGGALFLVFLWWFLTRPIRQLTLAAESISVGNFDTQLPTGKRDEIGTLARTFAVMVNEVRTRNTKIRRQNEELEDKVRRRTASLAKAKDLLEAAVSSRDAFLATISHELRTPLNHIFGYIELLEFTDLDEDQLSDLMKLQGSSRHMLRLVEDVLDYQKIIMGRLPVKPVWFDISTLLSSVHESNKPKAAQRNNHLVLQTNSLEGNVSNDEHRLRQILDNLVGNACKFTTDGTITIDARAAGEMIEIAVTDTGIGISEEGMEKLFLPFSKVSDSELNPDGTGLGLVISRELARKMGGDLTVTSTSGEGATFLTTVLRELPAEASDRAEFALESDTESFIAETQHSVPLADKPVRQPSNQVLVIDDDPKAREVLTRLLTEEGLEVITASNGTQGIELAIRHAPSVITLDLLMPEVDGYTVLAALKANEQIADIPVVLVTVLDDSQKGYSFGAADYVAKPIESHRLLQVVRRYCGVEPATVLIIDDHPKDREIVRRTLRNDGCRTLEAADGAEGLEKLEGTTVDLIVLDLMMPVMDGFTFVEELRKRSDTKMLPVIVLTAKEMTSHDRNRLNGMVSHVIRKGQFDRRRFLQDIHQHLDNVNG